MTITYDDLDGKYSVTSETSDGGPFILNGDGVTEIINSQTYRKDKNGFIWESSFIIVSPTEIEMKSTVDPSHAGAGAFIKDAKGNPTKGIVTYTSTLKVEKIEGKLVLSGKIQHSDAVTHIIMTKI
jgi:hypothetical protein